MLDIIVSQGRIGDRSSGTIAGAARTAQALERRYGTTARRFGRPARPAHDDWTESLPQARATLVALAGAVSASLDGGRVPVLVANTCSASLATLPVVARRHPDAVVLWIDAHGDFNTPGTTGSGYLGGMVLAAACGLWDSGHGAGLDPRRTILIGAHDIDGGEAGLLRRSGVRILPPAAATPAAVLDAIDGADVWIHIDWDVLEPGAVPADYKLSGGMKPEQVRAILSAIPQASVMGVEVAEFCPSSDDAVDAVAVAAILHVLAPLLERAAA